MFTSNIRQFFFAFIIVSTFSAVDLIAQLEEQEIPALKKQAIAKFEDGSYDYAEADFNKLMRQYPRDPMYRYYAGICKVELNKDLESAAELLIFASSRGVPEDVYYYLGEAYRKLYDFEKAKINYIQFDKVAPRILLKEKKSKLLISAAENALSITASYNPFQVMNVTYIDLQDPVKYSQVKMKGGDLISKPENFYTPKEQKGDLNELMFMPSSAGIGKLVYFSSLAKNGKNGFEIMQARKSATGKWVDIQPVQNLNSELNEILPYYDPVGRDIYFASDGREGLGGFDLYRAHYDEERGEWSDPVNLGFPVNSVYDDYLLLPGNDLGMVIIFSSRQSSDSSVAVYRIQLREPKESLATSSPKEIQLIANFDNIAATLKSEIPEENPEIESERQVAQGSLEKEEESKSDSKHLTNKTEQKYQLSVVNALKHQSRADSLTELATQARVKVRDLEDSNERWNIQKQIILWEKKAMEEQNRADAYFTSLDVESKKKEEDVIEKDTIINGITVYKYIIQDSISSEAKITPKISEENTKQEKEKAGDTSPQNEIETVAAPANVSFEILESSPYSSDVPIPLDISLPTGSFYRIQLGVFSKNVEPDVFGGLTPISGEIIVDRNLKKYYVGNFSRFAEAQNALPKVRNLGYNDAFIVAWYDGTKMSLEKVRKLEK